MRFLYSCLILLLASSLIYGLSREEKEQELEESLMKAIAEEENSKGENNNETGNNEEEVEEDEMFDEIYEDYKRDPKAWWSSRKANKKVNAAAAYGIDNNRTTTAKPTRPTRRFRWSRFKQKAGRFFTGVHHALKKVQHYAPHIIKGVGMAATLLGKKKRELEELERRHRRVRDEIRDIEDEMLMKKKK